MFLAESNHKTRWKNNCDFDGEALKRYTKNIYLNDQDRIHIPSYDSNVYIFGEVGNPGSVLFEESSDIREYIDKSGGFEDFLLKNQYL